MRRIFRFISDQEEQTLMEKSGISKFNPEEVIIREGETHNAIFIIRKGVVRVEKDSSGFSLELSRLKTGQIFGEMSFVEEVPASATIVADNEVEVCIINGTLMEPILETDPKFFGRFYQSLAGILSHRLRLTSDLFISGELPEDEWNPQ
ncbi:MAG: cyclic nucleotide-binding domain-containing protein [Gammaproteobacteria bacterium]|nr:cyclic nucleotide-binding domain-containing protein [Gammaproteobacteria bacterium]